MKNQFYVILLIYAQIAFSQTDTSQSKILKEITVTKQRIDVSRLPETQGTFLFSGKKSEVINVLDINANIAEKTPRQIFAKIPGVFVYDMDGSGNQINISTRGLDPHRGWEFNIRKNGIITNSDIYGYPASHFSLPMEAIERIELVRGTGSLQFGAQFGGMLNYITKKADTTRQISLESINSVGSYGLLSSYNAISGRIGKVDYYAFYNNRVSDGYRDNSKTNSYAYMIKLKYHATHNLSITAELARSYYRFQLPGPLSDSMFYENPKQSNRSRNYYSPDIFVPSLSLDWKINKRSQLNWDISAILGNRSSVLFDRAANIQDKIDPTTLQYANRQVDIDNYHSYTSELRFLHNYTLKNTPSVFTTGVRFFNNDLHRKQQGKGTTGTNYDLSIVGNWGRDLNFKTKTAIFFLENKWDITKQWSINGGLRYELGNSDLLGYISYLNENDVPNRIKHNFPLLGLSSQYHITELTNIYAGISQAYRPVILKDIIPGGIYEKSDKNLKNASGYNAEFGYRGVASNFRWDLSLFYIQYNNRLGNLALFENNTFYLYRTNIGNSHTQGVEAFGEYAFDINEKVQINLFSSTSFMDGRYDKAEIRVGNENINIKGNKIESIPNWISRNGATLKIKGLSVSALYSYTSSSYADPLNTEKPSSNGTVGLVPSYAIWDINSSYKIYKNWLIRFNINNLMNKKYFTKRPTFYPGPGIWSSDGRSLNMTIAVKI